MISALAAFVGLGAACERPALSGACPQAAEGELVLSEFRGAQSGVDTYGEWLEIYNAGDGAISLGGLKVRSLDLDGGTETVFLVRDGELELEVGAYAVLGAVDRDPLPAHLDYSFAIDGVSGLRGGAIVTIESCGEVIDETLYWALPAVGSWSLDGALTPDAAANDEIEDWCNDMIEAGEEAPPSEVGVPGTPGSPNRECAP